MKSLSEESNMLGKETKEMKITSKNLFHNPMHLPADCYKTLGIHWNSLEYYLHISTAKLKEAADFQYC